MPLTELDGKAALVVIDLQKGIVSMPLPQPVEPVIAHAAELAKAFRKRGLPVVLVNVVGAAQGRNDAGPAPSQFPSEFTELVPELDAQSSDLRVSKKAWGAFTNTDLDKLLRERGVTQIVLCGVATSIGVESTARVAHELGYNVVLVSDAMMDRNLDAHNNSLQRIFPRLGQVDTTAAVLEKLRT